MSRCPPICRMRRESRVTLARHYNCIARMDSFIGERLAELSAAGRDEDTIVFYYSDHGSPLPRSKRFCYDEGLRVPLIVHVPERWRHLVRFEAGTRVATPVSLVDLLATFAALAGCSTPKTFHGRDFLGPDARPRPFAFSGRDRMDEHADTTRTVRSARFRYIRNYAPHRIWGQHYAFAWESPAYRDYERLHLAGHLSGLHDRFWRQKPAEELYDTAADPEAIFNLVGNAQYRAVLDEMRHALDAHMLAIHDCGLIPEGSAAVPMGAQPRSGHLSSCGGHGFSRPRNPTGSGRDRGLHRRFGSSRHGDALLGRHRAF